MNGNNKNYFIKYRIILLQIIIIIVLFLICGEIYVRTSSKFRVINEMDVNNYRKADPVLHHCFIPGGRGRFYYKEYKTMYFINSLGFRDKEYSLVKPQKTFRIIAIGDSFAEGYGVNIEDSFLKVLEYMLNKNLLNKDFKNFEVINGGIAGSCTILEYLFLKNKCIHLNPNLVILLLDYSDFGDNLLYTAMAKFDEYGNPIAIDNPRGHIDDTNINKNRITKFISKYSMLYVWIRYKVYKKTEKLKFIDKKFTYAVGDPRTDRFFIFRDKIFNYDEKFENYKIEDNSTEKILKFMSLTFKYINLIKELCNKKGADFLLVIYPYGHQIALDEWNEGRVAFSFEKNKIYDNFQQYESLIKDFVARNSIRILSLYSPFKNSKIHPLYYTMDGHWTKNGHLVVAEGLYDYLVNSYTLTPEK